MSTGNPLPDRTKGSRGGSRLSADRGRPPFSPTLSGWRRFYTLPTPSPVLPKRSPPGLPEPGDICDGGRFVSLMDGIHCLRQGARGSDGCFHARTKHACRPTMHRVPAGPAKLSSLFWPISRFDIHSERVQGGIHHHATDDPYA